jgi:cytidylate kinase
MNNDKADSVPVIAIDGPGGSGKGTVAMRLVRKLGWHFLDSGVLYRLVALAAMDRKINADEENRLVEVARDLDVEFRIGDEGVLILLDGQPVSGRLRREEVGVAASGIASIPAVRQSLTSRQRAFRRLPGLVADGRDMGTVIFPDAGLKIFLTASAGERAQRRYKQLKEKGESVNLSRLFRDIEKRDKQDRTRAVAPLRPADDAVVIDSTELSIDGVLEKIYLLLEESSINI